MQETNDLMGFWHGYVFAINSIVGSGTLVIPWAYQKGGLLLGILSQLLTSFSSVLVSYHILQSTSRVKHIQDKLKSGYTLTPVKISQFFTKTSPEMFLQESKITENSFLMPKHEVQLDVRYDLTDMASLLIGKKSGILFGTVLAMSLFGCMMALSTIFASSLTSTIPLFGNSVCNIYDKHSTVGNNCWQVYWFYLSVLWAIVLLVSLLGIKGQQTFQSILSLMRYTVISIILGTCTFLLVTQQTLNGEDLDVKVTIFDSKSIGITLPIIFMTNYYHSCIPNITEFVKDKEKTVPIILNSAIFSSSILFMMLGILTPFAFGNVEKMVTMNWEVIHPENEYFLALVLVKYTVILFPAFIAISNFPIYAISLSDNLIAFFHSKFEGKEVGSTELFLVRFFVVSIPVGFAAFIFDLGFIFNVFGTLFLIEVGVFVPLLTISSKRIVPKRVMFDNKISHEFWSWFIILLYLTIFGLSWYSILFWA